MQNFKKTFSLSALAVVVSSTLSIAHAQDAVRDTKNTTTDGIEVIDITGSVSRFGVTKSNTPIVETARSLTIVTAADFLEKGATNLSQSVTYIAGVSAETFGFATRGDWIRARGLQLPRYRDSIQELFGSYNTTRAEVYTLEQVEILRGPASVMYGQGSAGGIANYVSKTPRAETQGEIFAQVGSFSRTQLGLDFNSALNQDASLLGRFVGLYRDADTQVDFVEDDTLVLMPSITFTPAADTSLTLIAMHQDTNSDIGSQFIPVEGTLLPLADGSFVDQDVYIGEPDFNQFDTQSSQLTLLAEHGINDQLMFHATALWRDGEADYHQAWPTFLGDGVSRYLNNILGASVATATTVPRSFYQADNEFEQMALDMRLSGSFTLGNAQHDILVGAQYQDVDNGNNYSYFYGGGFLSGDFSYVLDLANPVYTGAPPQGVFDGIYVENPLVQVNDIGIYVSDQISIENWRITLGTRYDKVDNDDGTFDQNDSQLSVSGGLLYKFGNGISPYLSYAESFETVVGITADGGTPDPQQAQQIEVGLKYEPTAFPGYFSLAYYDIEISNLPDPNSFQSALVQLAGDSELTGFEFEGRFKAGEMDVQLAWSSIDAEDPNGLVLDSVPDSNAAVWLTWEPASTAGFRLGAGVRYVGKSVADNGALRYETPSYTLGDIMLGYQFSENLDFALNVRNVADKEYLTSCLTRGDCFPGLRRSINGTLTYNF